MCAMTNPGIVRCPNCGEVRKVGTTHPSHVRSDGTINPELWGGDPHCRSCRKEITAARVAKIQASKPSALGRAFERHRREGYRSGKATRVWFRRQGVQDVLS